jgi:hypothetical protein
MSDLLKKKKQPEVSQIPVFDHDDKDITRAIGVPGLVQSVSDKMNRLVTEQTVTSPSKAVEYFYNNFSLIELAFMAMHSLGRPDKDEKEEEDSMTPFEEVI